MYLSMYSLCQPSPFLSVYLLSTVCLQGFNWQTILFTFTVTSGHIKSETREWLHSGLDCGHCVDIRGERNYFSQRNDNVDCRCTSKRLCGHTHSSSCYGRALWITKKKEANVVIASMHYHGEYTKLFVAISYLRMSTKMPWGTQSLSILPSSWSSWDSPLDTLGPGPSSAGHRNVALAYEQGGNKNGTGSEKSGKYLSSWTEEWVTKFGGHLTFHKPILQVGSTDASEIKKFYTESSTLPYNGRMFT